jgi:serine phosphatase RsbU (regulator of sigma subunit)
MKQGKEERVGAGRGAVQGAKRDAWRGPRLSPGVFASVWAVSLAVLSAVAIVEYWTVPDALGDFIRTRGPYLGATALGSALLSLLVARAAGRSLDAATAAIRSFVGRVREEGGAGTAFPKASGQLDRLFSACNDAAEAVSSRRHVLDEAAAKRAGELSAALEELRARDDHRERETKIAVRMQRRIVPAVEDLPSRPELAFGAAYVPAENTGGDIYDAVRAGKNGCAILVADVSGRGVTAALIAALVKNAFRSKAAWGANAAQTMNAVNLELIPVIADSDHYVTAFHAIVDLEAGRVSYSAAGHPPALLLRRRGGTALDLQAEGSSLGVQEDAKFSLGEVRLEEGDRIVFVTDGITGARNYRGEVFGRARLVSALGSAARLPVAELPGIVLSELEAFAIGAPRADDRVVLACEFKAFARPPDNAVKRPPTEADWKALARRGAALATEGKSDEAVRIYERLLEIEPEDAAALSNLGTLYWRLGRREEAAARFRAAAEIDPADPRILKNLALADKAFPRATSG